MRVLLVIVLVLLLVPGWSGDERLALLSDTPRMTTSPVLLDRHDPRRTRAGALVFMGGLELHSPDPGFGGFSSLSVVGDRFTLLSDGGNIVRFRMGVGWRPSQIAFANLPAGPGTGWDKGDRDSESMAIDPASGRIWIGFEKYNAIWRFAPGFARAARVAEPEAMADWDEGAGPESLVRLADGRFLTISEASTPESGDDREGLIFAGDPTVAARPAFTFRYRPPRGYDVSDATQLPDGRLAILNRRFRLPFLFTAKVTLVNPSTIRPGAVVRGREIATLAPPLVHDNFEGIAATREGRDTMLWLVSDDNQSRLQRSLLLKFRLDPGGSRPARRT